MNLYHDSKESIFWCMGNRCEYYLVYNKFAIYRVVSNDKSHDYHINAKVADCLYNIGEATYSSFPDASLPLILYMNLKPETKDWLNRIKGQVILDTKF